MDDLDEPVPSAALMPVALVTFRLSRQNPRTGTNSTRPPSSPATTAVVGLRTNNRNRSPLRRRPSAAGRPGQAAACQGGAFGRRNGAHQPLASTECRPRIAGERRVQAACSPVVCRSMGSPADEDPVERAWSASFLQRLPHAVQQELRDTAHEEDLVPGQNVYRELREPKYSFLALMVGGLLRVYVSSFQGRRIVIRYFHPGQVVGLLSVVNHGAPTGVEVVRQGSMLRLDPRVLERHGRTTATVGWMVAEELADRSVEAADIRLPSVFGSVKVRIAWHLLQLATEVSGRSVVRVTQQELADSVASVREVVARVLLVMTNEGLIARQGGLFVIEDPERMRLLVQSLEG
jgi:CRP/FNR family transcriptional regulator, cyclic AMP receptor protein